MKTKPVEQLIREYVKKVSEEDLRFIAGRLSQRLGGDLGEAMGLIYDNHPELNKIISSAVSCDEAYDMIDMIERCIQELLNNNKKVASSVR